MACFTGLVAKRKRGCRSGRHDRLVGRTWFLQDRATRLQRQRQAMANWRRNGPWSGTGGTPCGAPRHLRKELKALERCDQDRSSDSRFHSTLIMTPAATGLFQEIMCSCFMATAEPNRDMLIRGMPPTIAGFGCSEHHLLRILLRTRRSALCFASRLTMMQKSSPHFLVLV